MKIKVVLVIIGILVFLMGCGRDNNYLEEYQERMERFYDTLSDYNTAINSLDPESDTAVSDLLHYLDGVAATISEMASYDVPDYFHGVKELAGQADEYMAEAVSLYHQAYEAIEYDEYVAEAALVNYERVNLRLRYIAEILRGDIPEDIFVYD